MHGAAITARAQFGVHRAGLVKRIWKGGNDRVQFWSAVIHGSNTRKVSGSYGFAVERAIIDAVCQLRQVQIFNRSLLGKINRGLHR